MKKIPTLFERDPDDRAHVTDTVQPGLEWVLAGEGRPTRKYDGTCMMLDADHKWWARREVKPGKEEPPNFVAVEHDETTGKTVGWEPVEQSSFAKFHAEALEGYIFKPATYELCGPKINGNPEHLERHELIGHGSETITALNRPLTAGDIKLILSNVCRSGVEGVVWHHPDGRMAKLKGRDLATQN